MTEPADELLILVPAYTDAAWFAPLLELPICFIRGRVYFVRPDGTTTRSPFGSAIAYRGPRVARFADCFCDLGPILWQCRPMRDPQPRLLDGGAAHG